MKSVCITFDTDWAPEEAVEQVVELVREHQVSATFFATNYYKCLQKLSENIEVALHPNFNNILKGNGEKFEDVFDQLHSMYPLAMGFRSHSLTQSSHILQYAKQKGLCYDSNSFNPNQAKAFVDYSGLLRFTHAWVDLGHLLENKEFSLSEIPIQENADNILDFHPIHVFINTSSSDFYNSVKHLTTNVKELEKQINSDSKGIKTLFVDLLAYIKQNKIETQTLYQLYKASI